MEVEARRRRTLCALGFFGPPTRTLGMVVIVSRDERGGMLLFRRRADVAPVAGVFAMSARRACMQVSRGPEATDT